MKIDNSGDQDALMDTSMLCGRTRHEAATMEQTIRDIMRTTTSEGISGCEDGIFDRLFRFDGNERRYAQQHDQMFRLS